MEIKKEVDTNTLMIISLIFLLFIFLIIQPVKNTGLITLPLIGDTSNLSSPTLIGAIALLVIIWIVVFVLYIKLKKKKHLGKLPGLPELNAPIEHLNEIANPPSDNAQKKGILSEEELKQLFREVAPNISSNQTSPMQDIKKDLSLLKNLDFPSPKIEKTITPQPKLQPVVIEKQKDNKQDLNELKNLMISLLSRNYTRDSVIRYLQKKNYKINQIAQAIREINEENLVNYIKQAISLGYKKDQFIRPLLNKGWNNEDINNAMRSL